jgi:hypothetical protein
MRFKIPILLRTLIDTERWQHPGDDVLRQLIPRLADPVDFRNWVPQNTVAAEIASFSPRDLETFKLYRNTDDLHRPLPWLNADQAVFIAVNRIPGDDVAIALDYRDSVDEPTVVASCWPENKYHEWFLVAESFDGFARSLRSINA